MIKNFLFFLTFQKIRNGITLQVILLLALMINGLCSIVVYSKFFGAFTAADIGIVKLSKFQFTKIQTIGILQVTILIVVELMYVVQTIQFFLITFPIQIMPCFIRLSLLNHIIKFPYHSNFGGIVVQNGNFIILVKIYIFINMTHQFEQKIIQINNIYKQIKKIDEWSSKLFTTYVDQKIKYQNTFSDIDTSINICKDTTNDQVTDITFTFQHNTPTLLVIFQGDGYKWGISNIELAIDECSLGCDSCSQSQCFDQKLVPISIQWTTLESPLTSNCGMYQYQWTLGNFMEIQITLDPHNVINSYMKFHFFNADNPTVTVKVDDQLVQQYFQKIQNSFK